MVEGKEQKEEEFAEDEEEDFEIPASDEYGTGFSIADISDFNTSNVQEKEK